MAKWDCREQCKLWGTEKMTLLYNESEKWKKEKFWFRNVELQYVCDSKMLSFQNYVKFDTVHVLVHKK